MLDNEGPEQAVQTGQPVQPRLPEKKKKTPSLKEQIQEEDATNDGESVFLHYDENTDCYLAYGHSAYYADMVTDAPLSFS